MAAGYLSGISSIGARFAWCRPFASTHDDIPFWLGAPAMAALTAMGVAAVRAYRRPRRTLWGTGKAVGQVHVIDDDRPDAYALGGKNPRIVVSTGMLKTLDASERRVLLAHERSHLRHHHHRYVALASVAAASIPGLSFVTGRLRLAIERWADEDAAAEIGDRALVARTVIRAALARNDYGGAPARAPDVAALGTVGVRARVDALLLPPARPGGPLTSLIPAIAVVAVVGSSAAQCPLPHAVRLLLALDREGSAGRRGRAPGDVNGLVERMVLDPLCPYRCVKTGPAGNEMGGRSVAASASRTCGREWTLTCVRTYSSFAWTAAIMRPKELQKSSCPA